MKPDYLSETEHAAVQRFLTDSVMKEAVRKVLLSGVYYDGVLVPDQPADPLKNFILGVMSQAQVHIMTAEEKGKKIDAILNGISMVETGFQQLEKCKTLDEFINKPKAKHI